jgi:Tol biopolymer transport system component/tRNA A-37 threonylcarbamoyl transferase component Bud32
MIGKTLSHYKIIEKLGEGGMGVVYKAQDDRLQRTVAIKFLSPELTRDPEAKERFTQEARAASALDHNNICTIYEIDETKPAPEEPDEGQTFMVMACYDGEPLDERIERGPMKIEDAVDIASQIAQGLAKAHEKGIVHRDIKPANILVTQDNVVKILDFGLAKLRGRKKLTKEGTTVGTVAYMSPEQARGEEVDHRTDIWSLGIVLYEMIAGGLPFKGDYDAAVIYSILHEEPKPLTERRPETPVAVERIVARAMAKNPTERCQHVSEMLVDLQSLSKASAARRAEEETTRWVNTQLCATLGIVILVGFFIAGYLIIRKGEVKYQIKHTSPLTTAPGLEQDPSWSPEGTRIAYASDENGNMDVWVKQIAAGQKINLTEGHSGYDGKPAWSPDGEWLAFISECNGGGIFMLPALGGIPKQVSSLSFAISQARTGSIPNISWSPDGSELVYAIAGSLYTISSAGGIPSALPLPPKGLIVGYFEPAWSPDGKRIACTGFVAEGVSTSQIWSLHRIEDDPLPVTEGIYMDQSPVWAPDGKSVFFISDRGGSGDVWWLPVDNRGNPTGQARSLTAGAGVGAIAFSMDGTRLAYAKVVDRSNIWSIPIVPERMLTLAEALPLTAENHYIERLSISPDGQWIAFDSNRRGNMDIWIMRTDGSELRQLTTHHAHDWTPRWSPDGQKILFHSLRSGNRDLFLIPVSGGAITQLTDHPAEDIAGDWSPNGQYIAFVSNRSGNMDLWLMSSSGGAPQQLTSHMALDFLPEWAPDGEHIVFSTNRTGYYELFLLSVEHILESDEKSKPTQLTRGEWGTISACYWTMDGQTIYAYGLGKQYRQGLNLWAVSVTDGSAKPLLDLRDSVKETLNSITSDGERIYFPLWERIGDLWVAELETNMEK